MYALLACNADALRSSPLVHTWADAAFVLAYCAREARIDALLWARRKQQLDVTTYVKIITFSALVTLN